MASHVYEYKKKKVTKLSVFVTEALLAKIEKRAKRDGVSNTRLIEGIVARELRAARDIRKVE